MSRVRDLLRKEDRGFSLVEVLVSFLLLGVIAASLIPLFVIGARAATSSRLQTQAKNTAQERLEQMRQLAFHVDRQNGPYVDLLDYYYPNRVAASGTGAGWVSELTTTRRPGEPAAGAFYRVVFDPVPGEPGFAQSIATQFLRFNRVPVAQTNFASYDSQVSGVDSPPSLFLGVTIITTWLDGGQPRRFETFTQISDPGAVNALIATQARAVAVRAESTASDQTYLTAEAASAYADGRLSDGSSAAVEITAGRGTRSGAVATEAATATAVAPGGAQPTSASQTAVASGTGCGYAAFGRSAVTMATSTIADGVPLVPADVGVGTTPANRSSASLLANPGGSCGAYWFDNLSDSTDSRLRLVAGRPMVSVAGTTSGSAPIVEASAWVNGTDDLASPRFVRAGAMAATVEHVGLFFTDFAGGSDPLVRARLVSSSIECDSRSATPATAAYRVLIDYRKANGTRETIADFTWTSTSGPTTDPLQAVNLTSKVVYSDAGGSLTLADYIGSWSFGTSLKEGGANGIAALDAALRITSTPVRGTVDPTSSVGLTLGSLSCVADDNR